MARFGGLFFDKIAKCMNKADFLKFAKKAAGAREELFGEVFIFKGASYTGSFAGLGDAQSLKDIGLDVSLTAKLRLQNSSAYAPRIGDVLTVRGESWKIRGVNKSVVETLCDIEKI